jgi:4-diphosphocytidyl-2-C-methyl-D-erythritol kinase
MLSVWCVETLNIFCPAKLNLFLAVTERRDDGFHELISLVVQVSWGDDLEVATMPTGDRPLIECSDPGIPTDSKNLIWRAAEVFAARTGLRPAFRFRLRKRIPTGAGLGGGSSNAVGALKGMNFLSGTPLGHEELFEMAVELGSDCPLFLHEGPVIMRGRGERIEPVSEEVRIATGRLRFALFKPLFAVDTAWAYRELDRKAPTAYLQPGEAEDQLRNLLLFPDRLSEFARNSFDLVVGSKFPAIPVLLERLRRDFGGASLMSGSGSACALVVRSDIELERVRKVVHESWGAEGYLADVRLL